MLLISGFPNSYVLFLPPLLAEFHASRATTASPMSFIWISGAALGPVAGWLVARRNPRGVVMTGLGATALGLLLGSQAPTLPVMIASVGIAVGVGLGLTGLSTQAALLADSYSRRRGVAMGIAFSGSMAAFMLGPITQRLIGAFGWRGAFVCHAGALLALMPVAWYVLPARLGGHVPEPREHAAAATHEKSLAQVVLSLPFWSLLVVFSVPPLFGYLATTQHALYFPARGISAAEASVMLGAGGLLAASGRVLAGLLADRCWRTRGGARLVQRLHRGCPVSPRHGDLAVPHLRLRLRALPVPAAGLAGHHRFRAPRSDRRAKKLRSRIRPLGDRQ